MNIVSLYIYILPIPHKKKLVDAQNILTNVYQRDHEEYVTRKIEEIEDAISF